MATVALAWELARMVDAPKVGPTKLNHQSTAVAALDFELTDDEVAALEGSYIPAPAVRLLTERPQRRDLRAHERR